MKLTQGCDMNENKKPSIFNNMMMISIVIAAFIALIVSLTTGDQTVWAYMIPIGVAVGASISNGRKEKSVQ